MYKIFTMGMKINQNNIHITFNGNQSRFAIEGYSASDTQRIIASQGLTIVR